MKNQTVFIWPLLLAAGFLFWISCEGQGDAGPHRPPSGVEVPEEGVVPEQGKVPEEGGTSATTDRHWRILSSGLA